MVRLKLVTLEVGSTNLVVQRVLAFHGQPLSTGGLRRWYNDLIYTQVAGKRLTLHLLYDHLHCRLPWQKQLQMCRWKMRQRWVFMGNVLVHRTSRRPNHQNPCWCWHKTHNSFFANCIMTETCSKASCGPSKVWNKEMECGGYVVMGHLCRHGEFDVIAQFDSRERKNDCWLTTFAFRGVVRYLP